MKGLLKPPVSPSTLVSGQNKLKASSCTWSFRGQSSVNTGRRRRRSVSQTKQTCSAAGDKEQAGGVVGALAEGLKDLNRI